MTVFWAHISTSPAIEPVEMLYPGPVRWGPVRGRTPSRVATHDGSGSSHRTADQERRPGGRSGLDACRGAASSGEPM